MSDRTKTNEGDKIAPFETMEFPTEMIDPSPFQARKRFDPAGITEMAASIRVHGIIQPLVVRVADESTGRLELVAGERRWRGAKEAQLQVVPVIVRNLTATDAEELMLIENLQREDLTESEEAHGYERMLALKDAQNVPLYTLASLAGKLGKNVEHVSARLKLLLCPPEMVTAVDEGVTSVSVAMLVGRIPDAKARAQCAKEVLRPETQQIPLNAAQTRALIHERFMVKLDKKEFDLADDGLVPVKKDEDGGRCLGGACTDCPFRSGNIEGVEVHAPGSAAGGTRGGSARGSDPWLCTLPKCHKMKLDAAWRVTKSQAERDGLKTLDGDAAKKAFGGHNGDLAHDSGYVRLDGKVGWMGDNYHDKTWKDSLKGQQVPLVLARHPDTCAVIQLMVKKDATESLAVILKSAEQAAKGKGSNGAGSGSAADKKREEDEAKRRAQELLQGKIDKITVAEGVREVVDTITGKGMTPELMEYVFQMALDSSGADGMYFLGHWFEIKLPKGTAHGGRSYEEDIIKLVKERAQTPNAWLAYTVAALLAQQVKWHGKDSEDLEAVLKLMGIKMPELERRAQALQAGEAQAAKGKKGAAGATTTTKGTSTDPADVSTEKEVGKTRAADARALGKGDPRLVLKEHSAVPAAIPLILDDLLKLELPATEPNGNGVFVQRNCITVQASKHVSFGIDLARSADGRWSHGYDYNTWGPAGGGMPSDDELCESRAKAVKAAADVLQMKFFNLGNVPKTHKAAHADAYHVIQQIQRAASQAITAEAGGGIGEVMTVAEFAAELFKDDPEAKADEGIRAPGGALAAEPSSQVTEEHRAFFAATPKIDIFKMQSKFGLSYNKAARIFSALVDEKYDGHVHGVNGPSDSEAANGVQDSKIGKPERFAPEDIANAAECLAAKTTSVKTLIGPQPKEANKAAYNAWSKVRMGLIRATAKLAQEGLEAKKGAALAKKAAGKKASVAKKAVAKKGAARKTAGAR